MKATLHSLLIALALNAGGAALVSASSGEGIAAGRRFILHGVQCALEAEEICTEAEPLFDEVIDDLRDQNVLILLRVRDGETQEVEPLGLALSSEGAAAIRDYLVAGGIAPERIEIGGPIAGDELTGSDLVEVDLATSPAPE